MVIERLSRPDARLLLAPADRRVDVEVLHARRADLTAQLGEIGRDAVKQRIPLATVAAMTAEVETQLDELDGQLSASSAHSPLDGFADAEDVAEAWAVAGVGRRKAVIRELMTVTLVKAPRGRVAGWRPGQPYFNPRAVQIDWQPS